MSDITLRLAMLALVALCTWLLVRAVRAFVERRRQQVLSSEPQNDLLPLSADAADTTTETSSHVRILAFSSADCTQCHRLQTPALQRLKEQLGDTVSVIDVDAPTSPELASRYQVLTVPTTVILDATGKVQAINYGFANTKQLSTQIAVLTSPA
jgi:thioredoxin-like negative regulator of GroEL